MGTESQFYKMTRVLEMDGVMVAHRESTHCH